MAHISTTEQGGITSVSTQLSQEFPSVATVANTTTTLPWVLVRGAPRLLIWSRQAIGANPAIITLEAGISDDDVGTVRALLITQFVSPLLIPVNQILQVPSKLCRITITSPVGNATTVSVALMAAQ